MKKLKPLITFFTIILMIGSSTVSAQGEGKLGVVGKFFTSQEANVLFGKVISSISIKANDLRKTLAKANHYVLFAIKNNRIVIRDEMKNRLSDENEKLDQNETMYIFSKSQVLKLLDSANNTKIDDSVQSITAGEVFVEIRPGVLTLTAGSTTLEYALPCPPVCPE